MKRLTILPTEKGAPIETPKPARPPEQVRVEERRLQPRIERRLDQRRRAIARRVVAERRMALGVIEDAFFVESRSGVERRAMSARRKQQDRRAGVRKIDLTNLDLSELDH